MVTCVLLSPFNKPSAAAKIFCRGSAHAGCGFFNVHWQERPAPVDVAVPKTLIMTAMGKCAAASVAR